MLKTTRTNNFLICIVYIIVNLLALTYTYPIESKPLNDDPGTWFGDEWLIFSPRASLDSSALPLIGHDLSHVKKSKITPKSIFIAPNTLNHAHTDCPSGYRVDENGKCIKVVKINQDELLAARISELFKIDVNHKKSEPDTYADYYDSDDGNLPGPLQINLPLAVDLINDDETEEKTRVTYLIAGNVDDTDLTTLSTTIEPSGAILSDMSTIPTEPYNIEFTNPTTQESVTSATFLSTEGLDDETTTVAYEKLVESSIPTTKAIAETTEQTTSLSKINSTEAATINEKDFPRSSSLSQTFPTTTKKPFVATKVFSVDFLPKSLRKQSNSSRLKNYREQVDTSKINRTITRNIMNIEKNAFNSKKDFTSNYTSRFPNKNYPKAPLAGESSLNFVKPLEKNESNGSIKSTSTTNEPFWWLPKGWRVNESKEKPTLVRFWAQQPLRLEDGKLEGMRPHLQKPPSQRQNSRMPTGNIFHEMSLNEMEGNLKQK